MAEKKDPTQITLREAADAYNARGAGKVARFSTKGALKQYGDMPLVEAFTPNENGVRPIDTMLEGMKSQGASNSLQDDLRLISRDVNRQIFNADPQSPALNLLPGLESNDPQTFNIFGEYQCLKICSVKGEVSCGSCVLYFYCINSNTVVDPHPQQ